MRKERKSFLFKISGFLFIMLFLVCLFKSKTLYCQRFSSDLFNLSTSTFPTLSTTPFQNLVLSPISSTKPLPISIGSALILDMTTETKDPDSPVAALSEDEIVPQAGFGYATTADLASCKWCQKLTGSNRFKLVLDGEAVLDKETGLVWQRSPHTYRSNWYNASSDAYMHEIAGRMGWRLPTIEELASLADKTPLYSPGIALPELHPFTDVQPDGYWSSTTYPRDTDNAYYMHFNGGNVTFSSKSDSNYIWLVRGGQGHDGY